jgi:hypothetical protein
VVPEDPLNQLLHRTDVSSAMDSRVVRVPVLLEQADLEPLLEFTPAWCLLSRGGDDLYLVQGDELLNWLREQPEPGEDGTTDLTGADIRRWSMVPVPLQATLRQSLDAMSNQTAEAACIFERSRSTGKRILHGVLTRDSIEKFTLSRL